MFSYNKLFLLVVLLFSVRISFVMEQQSILPPQGEPFPTHLFVDDNQKDQVPNIFFNLSKDDQLLQLNGNLSTISHQLNDLSFLLSQQNSLLQNQKDDNKAIIQSLEMTNKILKQLLILNIKKALIKLQIPDNISSSSHQ